MTGPSLTRPLLLLPTALAVAVVAAAVVAARARAETEAGADNVPRRLVNDGCPVMVGEPASPLCEMQFRGATVRFCCSDCKDDFTEDPTPYLSRLPQLHAGSFGGAPAEAWRRAAEMERTAGRVDRWTRPVLLVLVCAITAL